MNDQDAGKIIRLLEEIRDGQKFQLERQAEWMAEQRARLANVAGLTGDAQNIRDGAAGIIARSSRLINIARVLVLVAVPLVLLLLAFVAWLLIARVAA